jgi:hypothetical protein
MTGNRTPRRLAISELARNRLPGCFLGYVRCQRENSSNNKRNASSFFFAVDLRFRSFISVTGSATAGSDIYNRSDTMQQRQNGQLGKSSPSGPEASHGPRRSSTNLFIRQIEPSLHSLPGPRSREIYEGCPLTKLTTIVIAGLLARVKLIYNPTECQCKAS